MEEMPENAENKERHTPNLFLLGAPKAGTTTLYSLLRTHPDICMASEKEPRVLELAERMERVSYEGLFDKFSGEPIIGEASPTYLFAPWVPERIDRLSPNPRLMAVLRNPVERAYSDWWMYYSRGIETRAFPEAIEENLERLARGPRFDIPEGADAWRRNVRAIKEERRIESPMYIEMGYYAEQLERYLDIFARKQLHIIFTEDLGERPMEVAAGLATFLGVEAEFEPDSVGEKNTALGSPLGGFRPILRLGQSLGLPKILPQGVKGVVRTLLSQLPSRPEIPGDTLERLGQHYEEHDRRLGRIIDRPIPWHNSY